MRGAFLFQWAFQALDPFAAPEPKGETTQLLSLRPR